MSIATETTLYFYTTPKQLREIADEMEGKMPQRTIGDSAETFCVEHGPHTMRFVADQTEFDKWKNNRENQQWV